MIGRGFWSCSASMPRAVSNSRLTRTCHLSEAEEPVPARRKSNNEPSEAFSSRSPTLMSEPLASTARESPHTPRSEMTLGCMSTACSRVTYLCG